MLKGATLVEQQRLVHALIVEKAPVNLELIPIFVVAAKETIAFSKGLKELHLETAIQLEPGLIPTLALIVLTAEQEAVQATELTLLVVLLIADHPLALAQAEAVDQATEEARVAQVAQVVEAAEAVLVAQVEVALVEDVN